MELGEQRQEHRQQAGWALCGDVGQQQQQQGEQQGEQRQGGQQQGGQRRRHAHGLCQAFGSECKISR